MTTKPPNFNTDNTSSLISVGTHSLSISTHGIPRTSASQPLLILIPGTAGTTAKWPAVIRALSSSVRILAFDRPGIGDSESLPIEEPPTLSNTASDLHALLAATHLAPPYILVGHSWGGMLATYFASTFPSPISNSIKGVVCLDSCAPTHPPAPTYTSFTTDPSTPFCNPCIPRTFQRLSKLSVDVISLTTPRDGCALTPAEYDFLKSSTSTPQHIKAAALEYQGLLNSYLPFLERGFLTPTPNERANVPVFSGVRLATVHAYAHEMFQRVYEEVYNNDPKTSEVQQDESYDKDKHSLSNLLKTWHDNVRRNQEQFGNLTEPENWKAISCKSGTNHDVMLQDVGSIVEEVMWVLSREEAGGGKE